MKLRESRTKIHNNVLQGLFIQKVLQENAQEIDQDIQSRVSSFNSAFFANRNFTVYNDTLTYTHSIRNRFVDMKTRQTKDGIIRKRRHAIHNKPIFGHLNNIIRQLSYGFTEAVKAELKQLDNTNI